MDALITAYAAAHLAAGEYLDDALGACIRGRRPRRDGL